MCVSVPPSQYPFPGNKLDGQTMRSKFDSYDLSEGEDGYEEKASSSRLFRGLTMDQSDGEKHATEEEQRSREEEESEKLSK